MARLAPHATIARRETAPRAHAAPESICRRPPSWRSRPKLAHLGRERTVLRRHVLGGSRPPIVALTLAVGVLLLIACVNIGNLSLVRLLGRTREIAIRSAVGARSTDVVRLFAIENTVLGSMGGALGVVTALALLGIVRRPAPPQVPRIDTLGQRWYHSRPPRASRSSPCWLAGSSPASWRRDSARTPCSAPIRGRARKACRRGAHDTGWSRFKSPWRW